MTKPLTLIRDTLANNPGLSFEVVHDDETGCTVWVFKAKSTDQTQLYVFVSDPAGNVTEDDLVQGLADVVGRVQGTHTDIQQGRTSGN